MARTGIEIMAEKLIKMVGLDPQLILSHIDNIRKSVFNASGDIATIRRDQLQIMQHLGIEPHDGSGTDERPALEHGDEDRTGNRKFNGH
jgi:hypothetical protein